MKFEKEMLLFLSIVLWFEQFLADWPETHCINGRRQAPIQIIESNTTPVNYEDLQFSDEFSKSYKASILNEDYTVAVILDDKSLEPQISGGGLEDSYTFIVFQFRWPSEHVVNAIR